MSGVTCISSKGNFNFLLGSDLKLLLSLYIEEVSLNIVDFDAIFKVGNKSLTLNKQSLIQVDNNNFIACITADNTEVGNLIVDIVFKIPDEDFSSGYYVQKQRVKTDINIYK